MAQGGESSPVKDQHERPLCYAINYIVCSETADMLYVAVKLSDLPLQQFGILYLSESDHYHLLTPSNVAQKPTYSLSTCCDPDRATPAPLNLCAIRICVIIIE